MDEVLSSNPNFESLQNSQFRWNTSSKSEIGMFLAQDTEN